MAEEEAPPAQKRLGRVGSFSGVWWKLGDAAGAGDSAAERRLRAIANEEADVRARIQSRQASSRGVRRKIALASLAIALVNAYWRRPRRLLIEKKRNTLLLLLVVAVPAALSTVALAAFAGFQKMLDARDEKKLERLGAERKSEIAHLKNMSRPGTGSHHNLHNLLQKYDPDAAAADSTSSHDDPAAAAAAAAAAAKLNRTRSRLSCFHIGDE